jgi:hypothetical protein
LREIATLVPPEKSAPPDGSASCDERGAKGFFFVFCTWLYLLFSQEDSHLLVYGLRSNIFGAVPEKRGEFI